MWMANGGDDDDDYTASWSDVVHIYNAVAGPRRDGVKTRCAFVRRTHVSTNTHTHTLTHAATVQHSTFRDEWRRRRSARARAGLKATSGWFVRHCGQQAHVCVCVCVQYLWKRVSRERKKGGRRSGFGEHQIRHLFCSRRQRRIHTYH